MNIGDHVEAGESPIGHNNLSADDILNAKKPLSFPKSVVEMMQGMLPDDDMDDEEEALSDASDEESPAVQQDIQTLDEFASDLDDVDIDEMAEIEDPLSDDLLRELGAETDDVPDVESALVDETDALADELLAELEADQEPVARLRELVLCCSFKSFTTEAQSTGYWFERAFNWDVAELFDLQRCFLIDANLEVGWRHAASSRY